MFKPELPPSGAQIGAGNRLKSDGQWNYTYDGNGNLLSKMNFAGTDPAKLGDIKATYTYDFRDSLTKVITSTYVVTGDHRHVATTQYWHNTDGRVTGQFVDPGDGSWSNVEYAYDGPNAVLAIGGADNPPLTARYLYGLNEDEILAWDTKLPGSSTFTGYWLMGDHQGSVRRELKDSGTIARRIDYDEFGNILGDKGIGPSPDLKYMGQRHDSATGLDDFGGRPNYDSTTGRFYTPDPVRQGTNWYPLGGNSGLNIVDRTGLEFSSFLSGSVSRGSAGDSLTLAQDYAQPLPAMPSSSAFDIPLAWTDPSDIGWRVAMRESMAREFGQPLAGDSPTHLTPASYSGPSMRAITPQEVAYNRDPNIRFMNDMFMQGGPQNEGQANGMRSSTILLQNNYSIVGSLWDAGHEVAPELATAWIGIRGRMSESSYAPGSSSNVMTFAEGRVVAEKVIAQVQINRSRGNAFRDMLVEQLRPSINVSIEKRVSPFLSSGELDPRYMVADIIMSFESGAAVSEAKLNRAVELTANQKTLMPLLYKNGGVVRTTGEYIMPRSTFPIYGPDLSNPWGLHL